MEAEPARRDGWKLATVHAVDKPTARVLMLQLFVPHRAEQLPGQHYIVRLTAPHGYTAAAEPRCAATGAKSPLDESRFADLL